MMWRSRTLWMVCISTLALGAGCVIDDPDDERNVLATWDLAYVGGGRVSCSGAGTERVRVEGLSWKSAHSFTEDFPCANGKGTITGMLDTGGYDITLSLLDAKLRPVSQVTQSFEVVRRGRAQELRPVRFEVQSFQVNWGISLEVMGKAGPASCADVGAKKVELTLRLGGSQEQDLYPFDCEPGVGLTQAIRSGTYSYQIRVRDAAGQPLAQTDVQLQIVDDSVRPVVSVLFPFK